MRQLPPLLVAAVLLTACASSYHHPRLNVRAQDDAPAWAAPPLERAVAVRGGRTGELHGFDQLLDRLAAADAVFLGETHTDETTHRVELAVYEGLLERRGGRVVLAMEMFERDVQGVLDDYLAGRVDEATFLSQARPWSNYREAYRPMIELAKRRGLPVVASNFPAPLRMKLAMGGPAALESLEGEARSQVPAELYPNSPEYWRRTDNAVRGHLAMMRRSEGDDERLYATQTLWDNSMGEACALALDEHPGWSVLHVNGGFHSAYWDGSVHQLRLRKPEAKVFTVSISPTANPAVVDPWGLPSADYVVYAEARASDLNDGTRSVWVQRELEYLLHLPEGAGDAPVPLLIWLGDDGFTAADGLALWRERLGDEVAIAVVEAPHSETQADLAPGGRWFWPDSFSEDIGLMESGVGRIWGYLARNQPIDPERVCLAGEGTGATVVAAVSLFAQGMDHRAVAIAPRHYARIKDFPLPLPELRGDEPATDKALLLLADEADGEWWRAELAEYRAVGFECSFELAGANPWAAELESENALRAALDLELREALAGGPRRHLLVENDSPRARLWARLRALELAADGGPVAVLEAPPEPGDSELVAFGVRPEDLRHGHGLPRCPGPFGGTTVLVVGEGADLEAWLELEENDPLTRMSRFHRVRVATIGGERSLDEVLSTLLGENRKNVLILPAEFCADGDTMRALARSAREYEDRMTLQWLPGLGAQ